MGSTHSIEELNPISHSIELQDASETEIQNMLADLKNPSKHIDSIYIYYSFLSLKHISMIFKNLTNVTTLSITNSELNDDALKIICQSLLTNTTLVDLQVSNNNITNKGAKYIKELLFVNQTLKKLNLANNQIGDYGIYDLSEGLLFNISLENLSLSKNPITEDGVHKLRTSIKYNPFITRVSVDQAINLVPKNIQPKRHKNYEDWILGDEYKEMIIDICNRLYEKYPLESKEIVKKFKISRKNYNSILGECLENKFNE